MKIEKLTNGNVLIYADSGKILLSLPPNCVLFSNTNAKILIKQGGSPQKELLVDSVSHTIKNGVETAFTGNANDLMTLLSNDFFKPETNLIEVGNGGL